ncbi:hypothetical protein MKW98_022450 [Papaver atlanticum]|uniref:Uncharacterized protein n=1 Tax=Papaver atlanticum TaxID=357466 RepID=A0AAD4X680_9MAGN|nr:hypothetical protein MKW98_022450 [Papaver atlanticum]
MCTGLQKQILGLVEERKVMVDAEVKAQKRITYLKEIVKRMESGAKEASFHAKTENMDLMLGERTSEDETMKKFMELETRLLKLEEEKLTLTIQIEEFNRRSRELGIQADLRLKYELDLEKKFEGYKTKHDDKIDFLENELKKYKSMCILLNEQVKSLEGDKKNFSVKERTQQEKIAYMCVQLNKKIMDLECEKRRAKDETEVLKTKYRELESQADILKSNGIGLGKELEICRLKCNGLSVALKEKEMECVGFEQKLKNLMLIKIALDDELEGCKTTFNELKEQIMGLGEDQMVSCEKEKKSQQRITYLEELVKKIESDERELKAQILRLDKENSALRCLDSRDNRENGFEQNEKNDPQIQSTVKVELGHELEGSSSEKLHILGQVKIIDSKDDKDIATKYTCNITDKERDQFSSDAAFKSPSDNGKNLSSMKGLKRPLANQRCEDYESIFKEDIRLVPLLSSISKRSRSAETVISRTESTVDDTIPVGSHKSLISLRQSQEKNSFSESTLLNHLHMSNNPYQKVGNPIFKNGKKNVVEEIGYESEGQCAGGIRVQCSYSLGSQYSSSDSQDSSNVDLSFRQALAMMKTNRLKNSKWLCMKAVCALYRQKFTMEKLMNGSSHSNNRGFNEYDVLSKQAYHFFTLTPSFKLFCFSKPI